MSDYEKTIKLRHDEMPAKVSRDGEITVLGDRPNNIPDGKEIFKHDESFQKAYERSWGYLADNLSGVELKIAVKMSCMAEYSTNSLAPLDGSENIRELAEYFKVSKTNIKKAIDNLFYHGVYASFKYCHYKRGEVNEWVFNPFVSFKGKLIDSDLKNLFVNTRVAKHFLSSDF